MSESTTNQHVQQQTKLRDRTHLLRLEGASKRRAPFVVGQGADDGIRHLLERVVDANRGTASLDFGVFGFFTLRSP